MGHKFRSLFYVLCFLIIIFLTSCRSNENTQPYECIALTKALENNFRSDANDYASIANLSSARYYVTLSEFDKNETIGGVLRYIHLINPGSGSSDEMYSEALDFRVLLFEFDLGKKSAIIFYPATSRNATQLEKKYHFGKFYTFNIMDYSNMVHSSMPWPELPLHEYKKCNKDKQLAKYLDERRVPTYRACASADDCALFQNYYSYVTACHKDDEDCIDKATLISMGYGDLEPAFGPLESFYAICQEGKCEAVMNCSVCNSFDDLKNCAEREVSTGGPWECDRIIDCNCSIPCTDYIDDVCPQKCQRIVNHDLRGFPYSKCCNTLDISDADCCKKAGKYWIKTTDGFMCSGTNYSANCSAEQECSSTPDGCCPNWCDTWQDADCCQAAGKYWLKTNFDYICSETNYTSTCSPGQLCSSGLDECCPSWCFEGNDADCCKQAGKYWLRNPYNNWFNCYNREYGHGCSSENQCEEIGDGCCPPWCDTWRDADCCQVAGKYWMQTPEGERCYDKPLSPSCSSQSQCEKNGDGCCANWCYTSSDVDCCQQKGFTVEKTEAGFLCISNGTLGNCSLHQECSSTPDGCCPSKCLFTDADCCQQEGKYWLAAYYGGSCYDYNTTVTFTPGCSLENQCEIEGDGCCPDWCLIDTDVDCCEQIGGHMIRGDEGSEPRCSWNCSMVKC